MDSKVFRKRPVPLADQVSTMRRFFPDFRQQWKRNIVIWIGELQPTPLSKIYRIKILYSLHGRYRIPETYVLKPQISDRSEKEAIPHVYPGNQLCLYHPSYGEWSQQKYIAKTIVPWASLWLLYYERWKITGEWTGGGEHPIGKILHNPSTIERILRLK